MSWEPPAYMLQPAADAILDLLPDGSLSENLAREMARAAIIAGRNAMLNAPIGRRHG